MRVNSRAIPHLEHKPPKWPIDAIAFAWKYFHTQPLPHSLDRLLWSLTGTGRVAFRPLVKDHPKR